MKLPPAEFFYQLREFQQSSFSELLREKIANRLIGRLRARDGELSALREEKSRIERRLRALAPGSSLSVEDGKVILQGEVLFDSGSSKLKPASFTNFATATITNSAANINFKRRFGKLKVVRSKSGYSFRAKKRLGKIIQGSLQINN